jgi:hypothetical protein
MGVDPNQMAHRADNILWMLATLNRIAGIDEKRAF